MLGESIDGGARLFTAVAHYAVYGFVPEGNYRKEFRAYARPATHGSWEQVWFVAPVVAAAYSIHPVFYHAAIKFLFNQVLETVKGIWTKPGSKDKMIENLVSVVAEQARADTDLNRQLAQGLIRGNDNLAALHGKLIDTLPLLAGATRTHGRKLVKPVGESCTEIAHFPEAGLDQRAPSILISEPDAEVIRSEQEMEVDQMAQFNVIGFESMNIKTGQCKVIIEGEPFPVTGRITDPVLKTPNNVYTSALNAQTGCVVDAKAVKKEGEMYRLYISNALPRP
jgi:hypothetical protein